MGKTQTKRIQLSIRDLQRMMNSIMEHRESNFNGLATTGHFKITPNPHSKTLFSVDTVEGL